MITKTVGYCNSRKAAKQIVFKIKERFGQEQIAIVKIDPIYGFRIVLKLDDEKDDFEYWTNHAENIQCFVQGYLQAQKDTLATLNKLCKEGY